MPESDHRPKIQGMGRISNGFVATQSGQTHEFRHSMGILVVVEEKLADLNSGC